MSQYPFFSIIIPTYNRAAFIEATLQSVLRQSYTHYEIIVVDNCSTDNTEEVLRPYIADGKINFIKHEQNFERARSRNTGMSAARGDFVTFLDSDDFMYSQNLADAAEFARSHAESLCFHNLYELVDSKGNRIYRFKLPSLDNQIAAIAQGNFMTCIGDFIHRDIYQNYRFDTFPALTGLEDWEFWLRVLADHKVSRIEKVNSGILHHGQRSVNNQSLESIRVGYDYLFKKIAEDAHLSKIYGPYLKRIQANSFIYMAILAHTGRMYKQARRFLSQAVSSDPGIVTTERFVRASLRTILKRQNYNNY